MINLPEELITVPLKGLRPFDMNPRITRNPDYEKIKASIRLRGLEHPPHITQRPGELFYIISSGGNTRLAISMNCGRKPVTTDTAALPVFFARGNRKKVRSKTSCQPGWHG